MKTHSLFWSTERIQPTVNKKPILLFLALFTLCGYENAANELEEIFTDAFCASFQQTIKNYRAEQYFGDVFSGVILWMERKIIDGTAAEPDDEFASLFSKPDNARPSDAVFSPAPGIVDNEYFLDKDRKLSLIRDLSPDQIRRFESDKDIKVVLHRYFTTLREGINYPFLGIFTQGSQLMRLEYPKNVNYLRSMLTGYRTQFPYRIFYSDDGELAALRLYKPGLSWPLFFRKTPDGYWKLDITKGWAYSHTAPGLTHVYPAYTDHHWMFAFPGYEHQPSRCKIPPLIPFPLNIEEKIVELENAIKKEPQNPANYFELADILYWECYWIRSAIIVVEKGLDIEPDNLPYRYLAIDMRYRFPDMQRIDRHYEALLKYDPDITRIRRSYSSHCWFMTAQHKKAVRILKKNGNDPPSKSLLEEYRDDYWTKTDGTNTVFRTCGYIRIFHLNKLILTSSAIFSLGLVALIIIRRRRARTKHPP